MASKILFAVTLISIRVNVNCVPAGKNPPVVLYKMRQLFGIHLSILATFTKVKKRLFLEFAKLIVFFKIVFG